MQKLLLTYAGSPESAVTASPGARCSDTTNGALYIKKTGTGNTGWVLVKTSADYGAADEVLQTNAGGTAREWGKIADANVASAAAIATSKLALTPATAQQYPYSSAAGTLSYLAGSAGKFAGWDQDGNVAAIYAYKSIVFLAVAPSSALSLGAHPSGEQDLANSDDLRQNGAYLDDCTQYRLHATIITGSASANTPVLYVQYSDDDSAWTDGDAGPATISLTTAGRYTTSWTNMATTFKTDDIYVRVAQAGGDDTATPSVSNVWVEFR